MSIMQRIESLRKRHAEIDHLLHTEETRPLPDIVKIKGFKREKLRLKDEVSRMSDNDSYTERRQSA